MSTALLIALSFAAAGELPAQSATPGLAAGCRCQPAGIVHFGNDWKGGPHRPELGPLVPRLEAFLDDWTILPKRLVDAFWWGGFYCAALTILGVQGVLAFVWILLRKP